jgi:hypothetical protein
LFNRDYKPIWQRRPGRQAERADPDEHVKFNQQEWYYRDGWQPWRDSSAEGTCRAVLNAWGISFP